MDKVTGMMLAELRDVTIERKQWTRLAMMIARVQGDKVKLKIFCAPGPAVALGGFGGSQTKTKFTKWSVSLKRLRTATVLCCCLKPVYLSLGLLEDGLQTD